MMGDRVSRNGDGRSFIVEDVQAELLPGAQEPEGIGRTTLVCPGMPQTFDCQAGTANASSPRPASV
jgi:hypothetical protein